MLRRLTATIRALVRLSRADWRDLLRAQWELLVAQALVLARPQGQLTRRAVDAPTGDETGQDVGEARRLATWVRRAAERGVFRPACLVRSVALCRMLEAHGLRGAIIRVGVRVDDGVFAAHAWVEYHGRIIGDSESTVRAYTEVSSLSVLHRT